jgi:hypothetical protein
MTRYCVDISLLCIVNRQYIIMGSMAHYSILLDDLKGRLHAHMS